MKRLATSLSIAALAALATVAVTAAADPTATPAPAATPTPVAPAATAAPVPPTAPITGPATGTISGILGMSQEEIAEARLAGQTLAQLAEGRGIDPQRLIDALAAQWGARIDARVAAGALTAEQAASLKAELVVRAKAMVNQATPGGMRGLAVGAGPGAMGGRGNGAGGNGAGGNGAGMGRGRGMAPGAAAGSSGAGQAMGRGRHGTGAGSGTCPMGTTPAPGS